VAVAAGIDSAAEAEPVELVPALGKEQAQSQNRVDWLPWEEMEGPAHAPVDERPSCLVAEGGLDGNRPSRNCRRKRFGERYDRRGQA